MIDTNMNTVHMGSEEFKRHKDENVVGSDATVLWRGALDGHDGVLRERRRRNGATFRCFVFRCSLFRSLLGQHRVSGFVIMESVWARSVLTASGEIGSNRMFLNIVNSDFLGLPNDQVELKREKHEINMQNKSVPEVDKKVPEMYQKKFLEVQTHPKYVQTRGPTNGSPAGKTWSETAAVYATIRNTTVDPDTACHCWCIFLHVNRVKILVAVVQLCMHEVKITRRCSRLATSTRCGNSLKDGRQGCGATKSWGTGAGSI